MKIARPVLLSIVTLIAVPLSMGGENEQSELGQWPFQLKIDPFFIQSDVQLPDPQGLEAILLQQQADINEIFSLPPGDSTIHIVLFGTAEEYHRYMQHYFPAVEPRRAIFLQDRGPGMLFTYWHDQTATDLRHEVTHALLNQAGLRPPIWLDEGLAKYFEVPNEMRFSGSSYLTEVIERAREGLIPSLEQLESIQRMADFKESHYRDSWAWVHLLMHRRPQTRQALVEYVSRLRTQTKQPPLHSQLTEILEDPQQEFQDHFLTLKDVKIEADPPAVYDSINKP